MRGSVSQLIEMGDGAARLGTAQLRTALHLKCKQMQNFADFFFNLLGSLRLGPQVEPYHDLCLNLSHVPFVGNS